ncbi:MAG TPA: hypothetical protein VK770_09605 [Candidatus Acidoferrum sp.]|jgi:hypothetical protein|nr:hypothetical protein [Candidatus Acidoferrum sp.]
MPHVRGTFLVLVVLGFSMFSPASQAQSFNPVGGLDCNGYSKIQKPLRPRDSCTDFFSEYGRGSDNGHYIGHDEPSIGFISTVSHSGNNVQWEITLPRERRLPATQSFENFVAFWFSMALCDPNSGFVRGPCIPNSDENNPTSTGSAFLEMQFYPPGNPPFITQISCDLIHWCASLHINSLENMDNGMLNPNCTETTNFAFIQRNGIPTGPPGPNTMTVATATPNNQTLLMNQGDRLRVTIKDVPGDVRGGVMTVIEDLTTGQSGFMIASAHNGYQTTDPNTCAGTNFSFHPEFDTAKFGNFTSWAALQANVNFAMEIGHFSPGANGDNDSDDAPCFPGPTVAGCLGSDVDFDGTSYLFDWPDGTSNNATSMAISSVNGGGIGPLSVSESTNKYDQPFPIVQIETDVPASEAACQPNGVGCVVPPGGATFYPYYTLSSGVNNANGDGVPGCALLFGNFNGFGYNNFGGDAQYGASNLYWFFGQNAGGPRSNPCLPNP